MGFLKTLGAVAGSVALVSPLVSWFLGSSSSSDSTTTNPVARALGLDGGNPFAWLGDALGSIGAFLNTILIFLVAGALGVAGAYSFAKSNSVFLKVLAILSIAWALRILATGRVFW